MKPFLRNTRLLFLSAFIGWLSTGCNKNSPNEASPQLGCRIQKYVAVTKSNFYDQTNQITYDYDTQGNLAKTTATMAKRPTSGAVGGQTGTTTVDYAYDADGYLTSSTSQELYLTTTDKTIREQITTAKSYSYANGRLAGYTINRIGAYGVTMNTTGSLAYDAGGNLVSKTETTTNVVQDPAIATERPVNSTGATRIWTYRNNQLIDYVERADAAESRPFTIQAGVITKIAGSNYEVRIEYDSQQRVTKQEYFVEGQLNDYYLQTWTDAKPSLATLPPFKGFPTVGSIAELVQAGVVSTRKTFYRNSVSKTMQQYDESTSVVQTNAQGFVTNIASTTNHPNPAAAAQDFTTTETYTYTGCQ